MTTAEVLTLVLVIFAALSYIDNNKKIASLIAQSKDTISKLIL